jgi:lipopolysaccharide export system permease protein
MWKIHRYYLKEVGATSVLSFLVLFGIVLIASVSRGIDRAQGADLLAAALIAVLWAADTFPHLLAISLLIATVLTFARASQDREITALRAAGISPRVPMVAALIIGLVFSIAGSYAHHQLIPTAHYYKYRVVGEALRNFMVNSKMSGGKIAVGGFFMSALYKDDAGHFHDVVVKLGGRDGGQATGLFANGTAVYAREAWLDTGSDGETLRLSLAGPRTAAGLHGGGVIQLGVNLREITRQRGENDQDLRSDQLLAEVERGIHENPKGAKYTVYERACFGLMPCLFAPIGFCIGVMARERGRMLAVLLAMIPMAIFYGCVMLSPALTRALDMPEIAWLPAVVVAVLGVPFCWRLLRV